MLGGITSCILICVDQSFDNTGGNISQRESPNCNISRPSAEIKKSVRHEIFTTRLQKRFTGAVSTMPPKMNMSECKCEKAGDKTGKIRKPPQHKSGRNTYDDKVNRVGEVYRFFMGGMLNVKATTKPYRAFFNILDDCVECLIYAINDCVGLLEILRMKPQTEDPTKPSFHLVSETFQLFIYLHDIFERGVQARNAVYLKKGKRVPAKTMPKLEVAKDVREKVVEKMKQEDTECLGRALNRIKNPVQVTHHTSDRSVQVDFHMDAIPRPLLPYNPNIPPPPPEFDIPPPPPPPEFDTPPPPPPPELNIPPTPSGSRPPPSPMNPHEAMRKKIYDRIKELEHRVKTGVEPGKKVTVPCQLHAPGRYCTSCAQHSKTPDPQSPWVNPKTPEPQAPRASSNAPELQPS